ncbi:MAG: hypothetical protein XD95_0460 [Microgenomates bacterium 39_7]|nr:MAG: hypothetical protein XD95_0460 [Microgenomates bacterium 39_7]
MSKLIRYFAFFLTGVFLGLVYLRWQHPELLSFSNRASLESGSLWTLEEPLNLFPTDSPSASIKILFAGDVMLDRHVKVMAQEVGYEGLLSDELKQLMNDQNLVVVNLEGPITQEDSISVGSEPGSTNNFYFTFEPETAQFLADHNMRLVNLGNNHITNFGIDGIISSLNYLYQAGVEHFGWVSTAIEMDEYNQEFLILQVDDFLLGFVNFNQFSDQPFSSAVSAVEQLRDKVEYLIVYTHWGIEYAPEPNAVIKNQAYQLIDAGADLIIGSHPHVIQPFEDYRGKRIYYSLGNFIFDQYFSPEVKRGQLVQLVLEKELVEGEGGEEITRIKPSFGEYEVLMESRQPVSLITNDLVVEEKQLRDQEATESGVDNGSDLQDH